MKAKHQLEVMIRALQATLGMPGATPLELIDGAASLLGNIRQSCAVPDEVGDADLPKWLADQRVELQDRVDALEHEKGDFNEALSRTHQLVYANTAAERCAERLKTDLECAQNEVSRLQRENGFLQESLDRSR